MRNASVAEGYPIIVFMWNQAKYWRRFWIIFKELAALECTYMYSQMWVGLDQDSADHPWTSVIYIFNINVTDFLFEFDCIDYFHLQRGPTYVGTVSTYDKEKKIVIASNSIPFSSNMSLSSRIADIPLSDKYRFRFSCCERCRLVLQPWLPIKETVNITYQ